MKKLIITAIALSLLITGCSSSDGTKAANSGSIKPLDSLSHNWGDINIKGGEVEHGFHFRNDGEEDLILKGAATSCMCTTAYFELPDGSISPTFGMHGNPNWEYVVKPGEEFEVEVTFDPMAHGPDAVGFLQRSIRLFSSSPKPEMNLTVQTNVLYEDEYNEKYGDSDFVFEEAEFDFGTVKQSGGIISHDFKFKYMGENPITVTAVPTSCACTGATISQKEFEPGDIGIVTVSFDPNLHEEPKGKFFKTVTLLTDPEVEKQPEIKIWAEMDLDLGPEAYKLKEEHID